MFLNIEGNRSEFNLPVEVILTPDQGRKSQLLLVMLGGSLEEGEEEEENDHWRHHLIIFQPILHHLN